MCQKKRNLTYSISIVDEGVVFIVSRAQVHVIVILVPFLSHSRRSLRQRETISRLSVSYKKKKNQSYRRRTYFASNRLAMSRSLSSSSSSSNGSSPLVAFSFPLSCSFCCFFCKVNRLICDRLIEHASKRPVARPDPVIHNPIALSISLRSLYHFH